MQRAWALAGTEDASPEASTHGHISGMLSVTGLQATVNGRSIQQRSFLSDGLDETKETADPTRAWPLQPGMRCSWPACLQTAQYEHNGDPPIAWRQNTRLEKGKKVKCDTSGRFCDERVLPRWIFNGLMCWRWWELKGVFNPACLYASFDWVLRGDDPTKEGGGVARGLCA